MRRPVGCAEGFLHRGALGPSLLLVLLPSDSGERVPRTSIHELTTGQAIYSEDDFPPPYFFPFEDIKFLSPRYRQKRGMEALCVADCFLIACGNSDRC